MKTKQIVLLIVAVLGGLIAVFVLRSSPSDTSVAPVPAGTATANPVAPPSQPTESPAAAAAIPTPSVPPAEPSVPQPDSSRSPSPGPAPVAEGTAVPPPAPTEAHVRQLSEKEIMTKLRDLGASNPAESLELARQGNRRFKNSPDAPERASLMVKALSNLDRKEEARAEALKMEKDYPKSPFTDDVHRHMLVNPPTHPAERGFGKKSELE